MTGTLTLALDTPLGSPEPAALRMIWEAQVHVNAYETLVELAPDGTLVPLLASRWSGEGDRRWRFELRPGVRFHGGAPLTAGSVVAALGPWAAANEASVRADGPAAVIVEVDTANPAVPATLAGPHAAVAGPAGPDGIPDGTGPFRIAEFGRDGAVLVPHAGHWCGACSGEDAQFTVVARLFATVDEMYAGLVDGTVDVIYEAPYAVMGSLAADPRFRWSSAAGFTANAIQLNCRRPPFDRRGVRRAAAFALDRQGLLDQLNLGTGIVARGPLSPSSPAFDPGYRPFPHDPRRARQELAAAGRDTVGCDLFVPGDNPSYRRWGELVAESLAEGGILAAVKHVEMEEALDRLVAGDYGAVMMGIAGGPHPDACLYPYFHTDGARNDTGFSDGSVDAALDGARAATDEAARLAGYRRAARLVVEEAPMLFTRHGVHMVTSRRRVAGLRARPDGLVRLREARWA